MSSNSRWVPFDENTIEPGTYYAWARPKGHKATTGRTAYYSSNLAIMSALKTRDGSLIFVIDGLFIWDTTRPEYVRPFDEQELLADLPIEALS